MILFQAFESLDVFGPLDALQTLSRSYQMDLALIAPTMDPVSTQPRAKVMNPKNSTFFQAVLPTHTFATAPPLDVLMIPGGLGTRAPDLNATIDWIAKTYPTVKYLITICTGAGLAAQSGVLDCKKATTNKASWASTIRLGPKVNWVPSARWTVDGNIWTSSGISAGIDVTLAFIAEVYGAQVAENLAYTMEYDRHEDPRGTRSRLILTSRSRPHHLDAAQTRTRLTLIPRRDGPSMEWSNRPHRTGDGYFLE